MKNRNGSGNANNENQRVAGVKGCSSGIGYANALQLTRRGYHTFTTMQKARDQDLHQEGESEKLSIGIELLDMTNPDSIKDAISKISQSDDRLDVLVNNAGYATIGAFEDLSVEVIEDQFNSNLLGC
jgi:NAD(P)-dependent dehydrogenase (short-subunit alcohol dehydrogenase family)